LDDVQGFLLRYSGEFEGMDRWQEIVKSSIKAGFEEDAAGEGVWGEDGEARKVGGWRNEIFVAKIQAANVKVAVTMISLDELITKAWIKPDKGLFEITRISVVFEMDMGNG
jgi:hypothetical protein